MVGVADPTHWKEPYWDQGPKYDKICEIIDHLYLKDDDLDMGGKSILNALNISLTGELDITGNSAVMIDLNPSHTTGYSVIDITPSASITNATMYGLKMDLSPLNPAGTSSAVYGTHITLNGMSVSALVNIAAGHYVALGTSKTNYGMSVLFPEPAASAWQYGLYLSPSGSPWSNASNTVGFQLNFSSLTADAGSPNLTGLDLRLPSSYSNFGTVRNSFTGAGDTVYLTDGTYALKVHAGNAYFAGIVYLGNGTTYYVDASGNAKFYTLSLPTGTSVNEIDTSMDASPTDNQLLTALAIQTYAEAPLMIGSGNAAWVNCSFWIEYPRGEFVSMGGTMYNNSSTDPFGFFYLDGIPLVRDGLNLYIKAIRLGVYDADASNYITRTRVYGIDYNTLDLKYSETTDLNSVGEFYSGDGTMASMTAWSTSGYRQVLVIIDIFATTTAYFDIVGIELECYYA